MQADEKRELEIGVGCRARHLALGSALALHHHWLVVEVLSERTAAHDRAKRLGLYRQVESPGRYLLVEQTRPCMELFRKEEQGQWVMFPLGPVLALSGCTHGAQTPPKHGISRFGRGGTIDPSKVFYRDGSLAGPLSV